MTHTYWLIINALAVYRLSILVSKDKVTKPMRERIWGLGRYRKKVFATSSEMINYLTEGTRARAARTLYELVICPWCLSVWFGMAVVALTALAPALWQYPAAALAISGVTVAITRRQQ